MRMRGGIEGVREWVRDSETERSKREQEGS
jgi:hypothetical protein